MASVDNRVVSITFDNASFEKKLEDTLKNLDKLTQSLAFPNLKNNSADLNKAFSGFNMTTMGSAIDGISAKFLALSTIGITVLSNIANRAVNAGITLAKSLSFDQISSGFKEYETNMNSIQTILANTTSKGSTLKDVSGALDELNTYADQTIYNFSEMTRNIGTFTAAGVDLDTSVGAIKGIANLAAISGSNSQQASTAMYQLSQAMASGTVKLMDWNSVVNAGMGGEVFQKALFESGKAAKTLADVPMGQTFDEWKDAGNTFRGSLESGWLTGEVLTNTLQGFTGDLTDAQIMSMGYTADQTAEIQKMGQVGKDAATKVKTLTQLIDTVKEAVGSGWSQSFKLILGDFEEAKLLFSGVSDAIGEIVGRSSDNRNQILSDWKELGGRTALFDTIGYAFKSLQLAIIPFREAFREIFPPLTGQRLYELTLQLQTLVEKLRFSEETSYLVERTMRGFFAAIKIGTEVVKGIIGVIVDLFQHFAGNGSGILETTASFGDFVTKLKETLIEGGKLKEFFARLTEILKDPLPYLQQLKDKLLDLVNGFVGFKLDFTSLEGLTKIFDRVKEAVAGLFDNVDSPALDGMVDVTGRLRDRFSGLYDAIKLVWDKLSTPPPGLQKFLDLFDVFVEEAKAQFKLLGSNIASAMSTGDFDPVMDVINTGLLGGLVLAFNRIASGGLDIGGGFFAGITEALGGLTGVLEGMQAKLKAEALFKIATAIGVLAASVLVLSLIDSGALTKALVAIAFGFTQLVAALAILNTITSGPGTALKLTLLAASLTLLGGAILLLSFAVKVMSTIDMIDMAKGLVGVTVLLGVLALAVKPLSANASGMIQAGVGIVALAAGLLLLSYAVKAFADMSWAEMAKGMAGVAAGLIAITAAVRLMPSGMPAMGLGIILVATGLLILAKAVEMFADMDWAEMGKGMAGIAGGLLIIAGAMKLMPGAKMLATGAGLVLVGIALNLMAAAVKAMSALSWTEMGKGLAGLAGMLILLAAATTVMSGSLAGASAIAIVAYSLGKLQEVLLAFSGMSFADIGMGLLGIAAVLTTVGVAALLLAPAIPAMFALGAAMVLLGAGFALFGVGASLAAAAFLSLAVAGKAGVTVILFVFDELLKRLPEVGLVFAATVIGFVQTLLDNAPRLISAGAEMFSSLLTALIGLVPQFGTLVSTIISTMLGVIKDAFPEFVSTGFALLMDFLNGILNNIVQVTTTVAKIIVKFIEALNGKLPDIVAAGLKLLTTFLTSIADNLADVVAAGVSLLVELLKGIAKNIKDVTTAALDILAEFISGLDEGIQDIITAGKDLIVNLINGIEQSASDIVTAGVNAVLSFLEGIGKNAIKLANGAADVVITFINALADTIDNKSGEIRAAGRRLGIALADGATGGLASKAGEVAEKASSIFGGALKAASKVINAHSPSRETFWLGEMFVLGFTKALSVGASGMERTAAYIGDKAMAGLKNSLNKLPNLVEGIEGFNPVITPVLDLTGVQKDAKKLSGLFPNTSLATSLAYDQAKMLSRSYEDTRVQSEPATTTPTSTNVNFEQNVYSPTALSTNDIYRATRSQIAMAKEELSIP